jgi:hypothetical protein
LARPLLPLSEGECVRVHGRTVHHVLVVRVAIWPGGDSRLAREVGRAGLANVSGLAHMSDYVCVLTDDGGGQVAGVVRDHERAAGFWRLLAPASPSLYPSGLRGGSGRPPPLGVRDHRCAQAVTAADDRHDHTAHRVHIAAMRYPARSTIGCER